MKSTLAPRFSLSRLFPFRKQLPAQSDKPPVAKSSPNGSAKSQGLPGSGQLTNHSGGDWNPDTIKPGKIKPNATKPNATKKVHEHKLSKWDGTCPHCAKHYDDSARPTWPMLFLRGVSLFVTAILMIVWSAIRLVRFVIGGALCLVGLMGSSFRSAGLRITHPNDRVWFRARRFRWAQPDQASIDSASASELN